jgi:uncharacterized protein YkwD
LQPVRQLPEHLMTHPLFRAVLTISLAAFASGSAVHAEPVPTPVATTRDDAILLLVNAHRARIGKPGLQTNQLIWEQANGHSCNMASGAVSFGHDGFEARVAIIRTALGTAGSAAENVAMGHRSPEEVVSGWLSSPGHRANIESHATRTGISSVSSGSGVWYYTQVFY